jgi:hypothetical protein
MSWFARAKGVKKKNLIHASSRQGIRFSSFVKKTTFEKLSCLRIEVENQGVYLENMYFSFAAKTSLLLRERKKA